MNVFKIIDNNSEIINVINIVEIHFKNVDSPVIIKAVILCSTFQCIIYTRKEYFDRKQIPFFRYSLLITTSFSKKV